MKKIISLALIGSFVFSTITLGACSDKNLTGEAFKMPDIKYTTYDNADFSDYTTEGKQETQYLSGQWENYGVGDPYVFRFDGTYYMYCSSRDGKLGIRAWKSSDLIHWSACTAKGFPDEYKGYVSIDESLIGAFAPEVYYFNGTFYLYSSPAGTGHRIYQSLSPEGPFVKVTDRYDSSIDGSVFIDDDESMYFLHAGSNGIVIKTMQSMSEIGENYRSAALSNAVMGSWTEGPMLIKRDGIYYLTYTGTDVESEGYRVSYSTEKNGNALVKGSAFTRGVDLPIILTADEPNNFKGLGHSSTVLGPDMDSYYIVYHSLNQLTTNGPYRSMNIDRLIFNGTQMSVDESKNNSIAATMPAFSASGVSDSSKFVSQAGKVLSTAKSGKVFTSEYNFKGSGVSCIFSYESDSEYAFVKADYSAKKIELYKVSEGSKSLIASGTLKNAFDPEVLHTIRVAYADGKIDVYFDNMCKIDDVSVQLAGGKIGYEGAGEISYTAFSNVAGGYSDRVELKQSGASIGAANYLPSNYFEGITSYSLSDKSGVNAVELSDDASDAGYNGAYSLTLGKKGDFARYLTYFREKAIYGCKLTYEKKYGGMTIGVRANGGTIQKLTLPKAAEDLTDEVVSANVGAFEMSEGANIISLCATGDTAAIISFSFEKIAYGDYQFSESLENVVEKGASYSSMYRLYDGGHATRGGSRMLVWFGNGTLRDYEIEVKIKFISHNAYSAGLIVRSDNFAHARNDDVRSIQGYYASLDSQNVSISKFNHGYSRTNIDFDKIGKTEKQLSSEYTALKLRVEGNSIKVFIDGNFMFEYYDAHAFTTGYAGLYSDGAEVVYKDLLIKSI